MNYDLSSQLHSGFKVVRLSKIAAIILGHAGKHAAPVQCLYYGGPGWGYGCGGVFSGGGDREQ